MKNKVYIIFLIVFLIVVGLGIIILFNNKNKEQNKISMISINNIRINQKATKKMKKIVLDADHLYEYNYVGFDVNKDGYIKKIVFYSFKSGEQFYGINDAKVKYKDKRLTTVEDFNSVLGKGEEKVDDKSPSYKYINYNEDNYELTLTLYNENIINIKILKK